MNIRAITLDLDDTLWPVWPAIQRGEAALDAWLHTYAPAVAAAHTPESIRAIRDELVAASPPGTRHDIGALRTRAIATALERVGDDPAKAVLAYAAFHRGRQDVAFYPDSLDALQRLAARYPLAALSNGTAEISTIGIGHHFKFALSPIDTGVGKPDARIFHAACTRLGVAPGQVLHVGDDAHLDMVGARRAGLRTAWINRARAAWPADQFGDERPDHEFNDVGALADWLLAN